MKGEYTYAIIILVWAILHLNPNQETAPQSHESDVIPPKVDDVVAEVKQKRKAMTPNNRTINNNPTKHMVMMRQP